LPLRYREVVVLCDLEEISYSEAAVVLECAIGTVRSRLHRARTLLAAKVRVHLGPSEVPAGKRVPRCLA
jgi:RNA polymerase sigma-70 factor, ECF subfamily